MAGTVKCLVNVHDGQAERFSPGSEIVGELAHRPRRNEGRPVSARGLAIGYAIRIISHNALRVSETMDARDYWNSYVKHHGGVGQTAARLGLPYSTVAGICNGSRGIGRDLAMRMVKADPLLDPSRLFYVRPARAGEAKKAS